MNRSTTSSHALKIRKSLRFITNQESVSEWLVDRTTRLRDQRTLRQARSDQGICWLEDVGCKEPLVTIRIATKDRPDLLLERSVAAALRQTYENIEILVIGDGCDEQTARALGSVRDPRLRYINLTRQGRYPTEPRDRWRVAGCKPMNAALYLATGDWIAPCDDDDAFTHDHVESLLSHAKTNGLEFVWSKSRFLEADGGERIFGDENFHSVTHGSVFYSMGLDFFTYSPTCYRIPMCADQNLWWRMRRANVRMGFLDKITYNYWQAGDQQYRIPKESITDCSETLDYGWESGISRH